MATKKQALSLPRVAAALLFPAVLAWLHPSGLAAQSYQVIHTFGPGYYQPESALIADSAGNLYGTTRGGGASGLGTVFKLDAASGYALTTLHSFAGIDGAHPSAAVIADAAGNLYGTTYDGGPSNFGTVFRLDAGNGWALTTLHVFASWDGSHPSAAVLADAAGNLFGTTRDGGTYDSGTVFELDAASEYALTTLYDFWDVAGVNPYAALIADASGNLYGTTSGGGNYGRGVVFRLDAAADYALTTLHDFDSSEGGSPQAKLLLDASGNLYGTTSDGAGTVFRLDAASGYTLTTLWVSPDGPLLGELVFDASGNLYGTARGNDLFNSGAVFRLLAGQNYGIDPLHDFHGADGAHPVAAVLADPSGNLYGTTRDNATVFRLDAANAWALTTLHTFAGPGTYSKGALLSDSWGNLYGTTSGGGAFGYGTVFRLDAANGYALTTLHDFHGDDGRDPEAAVVADASGNLYGTTVSGGPSGLDLGTAFMLDAANGYALSTLHEFTGADGASPWAPLILDASGNLYGTTYWGGSGGYGTVFELDAANGYALSTLHAFGLADGGSPEDGLLADAAGNLYGSTRRGGTFDRGTVFRLEASNDWQLTTLHDFGGPDGSDPSAVIADTAGNLYGTTFQGGPSGLGTVFKLDAANGYALTTLHAFDSFLEDALPAAPLVMDASGNLFGTTSAPYVESPGGTVFELDASNGYAKTTLHHFYEDSSSGGFPQAALILDAAGTLFGTTMLGGAAQDGLVFSFQTGVPAPVSAISPTSGPSSGGTAVTVTGIGFTAPLTLRIGGALAGDVTVVASTEVTGVTPPLPPGRLNDVEVTNAAAGPSVPFVLAGAFFSDFLDVPQADLFHADVEKIFRDGITAGCGSGYYCRNNPVTRDQMAVFLLKSKHGSFYVPPPCTGLFADVACTPVPAFAADWIEQLAREGITAGCGGGNYCPGGSVTRAQMAVLLLKAKHGSSYVPPACSGRFLDVECTPVPAFAVDWIEELSTEGITAGCGGGNYCPGAPVNRGQMATFLVRTFGLP